MQTKKAEKQGYYFTGITYNKYYDNEAIWKEDKAKAAMIKKNYKDADYMIINGCKNDWLGSNNIKAIMGNKVFLKVMEEDVYKTYSKKVNSYKERKANLIANFKEQLKKLDDEYQHNLKMLNEIESLRK